MKTRHRNQIIGLTGIMGSGKTTVTTLLRQMKFATFCADVSAHRATQKDTLPFKAIVDQFGKRILNPKTGEIDRKQLAARVFKHPAQLKRLEAIIHPFVRAEIHGAIRAARKKKTTLFLDIPLLYEGGFDKVCDKVIVIDAHKRTIIERLKSSRHMSEHDINVRLANQMPSIEKLLRCDAMLFNNGSADDLKRQVRAILDEWGIEKTKRQ